jgi:transcriptional regulator with XRE-family HTH domain
MASENYRGLFADRLRSLRLASDLTIEQASDRGELSSNFWGAVERNEQEPCLDSIFGFAKGLGTTPAALLSFADRSKNDELRVELNDLLDLCNPQETEMVHKIVKVVYTSNRQNAS